jgi:hypothetical protein
MDALALTDDFAAKVTKPTACNQSVYVEGTPENEVKLLNN